MTTPSFIIVAIDGGAASGKSSTSRGLSERHHLMHVDTGSFYRAVTKKLIEANIRPSEGPELEQALEQLELGTAINRNAASITINGWSPDQSIRSQEVNENVSQFAALPTLRRFLLDYQREQADVARNNGFAGLVMEGRDIGSVIFPNADVRIFLEADPAERERRRANEGITDSIQNRDKIDSQRTTAPLACPEGASRIDSTHLTLDEVIAKAGKLVEATLQQ